MAANLVYMVMVSEVLRGTNTKSEGLKPFQMPKLKRIKQRYLH